MIQVWLELFHRSCIVNVWKNKCNPAIIRLFTASCHHGGKYDYESCGHFRFVHNRVFREFDHFGLLNCFKQNNDPDICIFENLCTVTMKYIFSLCLHANNFDLTLDACALNKKYKDSKNSNRRNYCNGTREPIRWFTSHVQTIHYSPRG